MATPGFMDTSLLGILGTSELKKQTFHCPGSNLNFCKTIPSL